MIEQLRILTRDKVEIAATVFRPESHPKAGIIINSATAVKQSYYANFAQYLMSQGFVVISYDYRSIGASKISNKTSSAKLAMRAWGEQDFAAVIDWASAQFSELDWHCIGHSVGGQLIGLAHNNTRLKSAYCVAAQSGYWGHWGIMERPKILLTWYGFAPLFSTLIGKMPGFLLGGESLPAGIAKEWARWCRHPDYIVDENGQPIREGFERLRCKIKFLIIDDDKAFAPAKAVEALSHFYTHAQKDIQTLYPKAFGAEKIGHFGFFKRQHQQSLWQLPMQWFSQFS